MKRAAGLLAGFLCFAPLPLAAQRGSPPAEAAKETVSIEGRIVSAVTGEPVRQANVTVMLLPPTGGIGGRGRPPGAAAASDADGRFKLENLPPGRYLLAAEKTGFLRQQYGAAPGQPAQSATPLSGAPGENIKDIEFRLTPQGIISGKVMDENGEPVPQAGVSVLRQTAYFRSTTGGMRENTNALGEFLIGNLAPGKYILRAEYSRGRFGAGRPPKSVEGVPAENYLPTYYPGTTDLDAAGSIAVSEGQQVSGIEIWLKKGRVYRVRGQVAGMPADGASRMRLSLEPQKRMGGATMEFGGAMLGADGSFEFSSVQPGSYVVTAMGFAEGRRPQAFGMATVTVTDNDVDGVILQASVPVPITITGSVKVQGEEKAALQGSVILQPMGGFGFPGRGAPPARLQSDGTFQIEGVSRGKYYINVTGLPAGSYLKQVTAGGADVLDSGLDLSQADTAPAIEILVSRKAATIEGEVRHEDKPWPGASITLAPEPLQLEQLRRQRTATSGADGRFTLTGIAPGEYRLYAWEESVSLASVEPEDLKPYEADSVKVRVGEGAREQVELHLAKPQP